mmetsp:Transcript_13029/g.20213  ORF Transcript_13029/g.20213 Transcript_13029/m.20213 type:complete len:189 (+) Transcript_13029:1077-1643(+)
MQGDEDVSRMTYIQAPKDEPANLDMSAFDKPNVQMQGADNTKKDFEIISECMEKHSTFSNVMQRRIANMKTVMNYLLNDNDLVSAVNSLGLIKDTTVTMDFLNSTFAKNKRLDLLNFDKIVLLMPYVQEMIDSKYETHNVAGLKSALNILRGFSQSIIDIKRTAVMGGVDLAREDRIRKADDVIEVFF